jgi:hypothetical protein
MSMLSICRCYRYGTQSKLAAWPGRGLQGTFGPWRWRAPRATAAGASTQARLSSSPSMMGGGGDDDDAKHGGEKD